MQPMSKEMEVPHQPVVRQPPFGVENKSMQTVLNETEHQNTSYCCREKGKEVESFPRGHAVEEVGHDGAGGEWYMIPLVVSEGLEPVGFEESGRFHEHPVRRVDEFHVGALISFPDLRGEGFVGIDKSVYLFSEGADGHGVGHDEGEGVMKLHFFLDILEMFISEEEPSSGVMGSKRSDIEDIIIMEEEYLLFPLSVALHLFNTFKHQVDVLIGHEQFIFEL